MSTTRILSTNTLANSEHYEKILGLYNDQFRKSGPVNNKKFYEEIILPFLPGYKLGSWYKFLKRFETTVGLQAPVKEPTTIVAATPGEAVLLSNTAATSKLITNLLNVSAARAAQIIANPEMITHAEAIKLGLAAMKAQDSRIHAIGKIREDSREQDKFDRAFSDASNG